jgi:hypothetical protein
MNKEQFIYELQKIGFSEVINMRIRIFYVGGCSKNNEIKKYWLRLSENEKALFLENDQILFRKNDYSYTEFFNLILSYLNKELKYINKNIYNIEYLKKIFKNYLTLAKK